MSSPPRQVIDPTTAAGLIELASQLSSTTNPVPSRTVPSNVAPPLTHPESHRVLQAQANNSLMQTRQLVHQYTQLQASIEAKLAQGMLSEEEKRPLLSRLAECQRVLETWRDQTKSNNTNGNGNNSNNNNNAAVVNAPVLTSATLPSTPSASAMPTSNPNPIPTSNNDMIELIRVQYPSQFAELQRLLQQQPPTPQAMQAARNIVAAVANLQNQKQQQQQQQQRAQLAGSMLQRAATPTAAGSPPNATSPIRSFAQQTPLQQQRNFLTTNNGNNNAGNGSISRGAGTPTPQFASPSIAVNNTNNTNGSNNANSQSGPRHSAVTQYPSATPLSSTGLLISSQTVASSLPPSASGAKRPAHLNAATLQLATGAAAASSSRKSNATANQPENGETDPTPSTSASHQGTVQKRALSQLLMQVAPGERFDAEVEEILLEVADEFIDTVTHFSCQLAKHRGSTVLDLKDMQLHLERHWNMHVPGFHDAGEKLEKEKGTTGGAASVTATGKRADRGWQAAEEKHRARMLALRKAQNAATLHKK